MCCEDNALHRTFANAPNYLHMSPQPCYVITIVPILKMRKWGLEIFE